MKTKFLALTILLFAAEFLHSQGGVQPFNMIQNPPKKESLVNWLTFKEAQELNKKTPKPFLIDVYTDWCGWCKVMMKNTYSDPQLSAYINNYFYPVKFDAETKDTIIYNGVKFWNESTAPKTAHQLAKKLCNNSLTYPSTIFVNNNFQFNLLTQGYLEVKKIEPILIYTVENIFRTSSFDDFKTMFDRTFYDTLKLNHPENVKWLTYKEAMALQKTKPRKILISTGTNWCSGCRVMNSATFCDPLVAEYINKNFYLVNLDAQSNDTLNFNGKDYLPSANPQFPFHGIVPVLTKGNLVLPSLIFLDEKQNILESVPFYQTPKNIDPVLHYFGDNAYLKMKWDEYVKAKKEKEEKEKIKATGNNDPKKK